MPERGTLYVCATPIGNMDDITLRVLRVLSEVDLIAAEDTRHTGKLLRHHGIDTPMISYHDHNETGRAEELVGRLIAGERVALVSDAGTPAISDPGYALVKGTIDAGIDVVALPGASAFLTALVASGLPPHPFYFGGFLPRKGQERRRLFQTLASLEATLIFYEAPHRIVSTLKDVAAVFPGRDVAVARELTKKHEEIVRGVAEDVCQRIAQSPPRGEFVLVIAPATASERQEVSTAQIVQMLEESLKSGKTKREAVLEVASLLGVNRNRVYDAAIQLSTTDVPDTPDP